jgi:hypothetical protein
MSYQPDYLTKLEHKELCILAQNRGIDTTNKNKKWLVKKLKQTLIPNKRLTPPEQEMMKMLNEAFGMGK